MHDEVPEYAGKKYGHSVERDGEYKRLKPGRPFVNPRTNHGRKKQGSACRDEASFQISSTQRVVSFPTHLTEEAKRVSG